MRYTTTFQPLNFEALAYRPRDYVEAQLLLTTLYSDIMCTYGHDRGWMGRVSVGVQAPGELGAHDRFVQTGLLDIELESDADSVVGVAWVETNDLGHIVIRHSFHAPHARDMDHGWTEPCDFLGTTGLGRTLRDWLT